MKENFAVRGIIQISILAAGLFSGSFAFAAEICHLANGQQGIPATYANNNEVLLCVPPYYGQLMGGKIDPDRMDVCKGPDENIAAPSDKVPFTVNGSSLCLDRQTAEQVEKLIPFKMNQ